MAKQMFLVASYLKYSGMEEFELGAGRFELQT